MRNIYVVQIVIHEPTGRFDAHPIGEFETLSQAQSFRNRVCKPIEAGDYDEPPLTDAELDAHVRADREQHTGEKDWE